MKSSTRANKRIVSKKIKMYSSSQKKSEKNRQAVSLKNTVKNLVHIKNCFVRLERIDMKVKDSEMPNDHSEMPNDHSEMANDHSEMPNDHSEMPNDHDIEIIENLTEPLGSAIDPSNAAQDLNLDAEELHNVLAALSKRFVKNIKRFLGFDFIPDGVIFPGIDVKLERLHNCLKNYKCKCHNEEEKKSCACARHYVMSEPVASEIRLLLANEEETPKTFDTIYKVD